MRKPSLGLLAVLWLATATGMVTTPPALIGRRPSAAPFHVMQQASPPGMVEVRRKMAVHRARRSWIKRKLGEQGLSEAMVQSLTVEMDQHLVSLAELESEKCALWRRAKLSMLLEKRALLRSLRGWQGSHSPEEGL
jgi:hypothetical protein